MRRRLSTYLTRPFPGTNSSSTPPPKDDAENWKENLSFMLDGNETGVEEVCFGSEMAFDEVSSPVLAYKFSGQDFDPEKCKHFIVGF